MDTDDITDGMPAHINQATQTGIAKMNADEARALAQSKHEATYTDRLVEYHLKQIKLAADAGLFETSFMRGLRGVYSQADRNATARRLREMGYAVENDTISWH